MFSKSSETAFQLSWAFLWHGSRKAWASFGSHLDFKERYLEAANLIDSANKVLLRASEHTAEAAHCPVALSLIHSATATLGPASSYDSGVLRNKELEVNREFLETDPHPPRQPRRPHCGEMEELSESSQHIPKS